MQRGVLVLVLICELQWFVGADEAGEEGEYGHADAALEGNANDGQLPEPGHGNIIVEIPGEEERVVEGAGNVGDDDEEGSETSKALSRSRLAMLICKYHVGPS